MSRPSPPSNAWVKAGEYTKDDNVYVLDGGKSLEEVTSYKHKAESSRDMQVVGGMALL
jgi:hypothetical protein